MIKDISYYRHATTVGTNCFFFPHNVERNIPRLCYIAFKPLGDGAETSRRTWIGYILGRIIFSLQCTQLSFANSLRVSTYTFEMKIYDHAVSRPMCIPNIQWRKVSIPFSLSVDWLSFNLLSSLGNRVTFYFWRFLGDNKISKNVLGDVWSSKDAVLSGIYRFR